MSLLTQYLGQQPHIMKASGVDPGIIDAIGRVSRAGRPEEIREAMAGADDVVQQITASGTPEECRAKVTEYVDAGATCPVLYPSGTSGVDDRHLRCLRRRMHDEKPSWGGTSSR